MFDIETELKKLPSKPGVYIMRDKNDKIIYVGKAISLRNRVRQYFRKNNKTQRIENMVSLIDHFEYIVTDNEVEALVLECNMIKKNMPKFNVLLKDGKTYPYIKVNLKADFPDIYLTRRRLNDGSRYFGPYPNVMAAKELIDYIKTRYKLRLCKSFKHKDRPCLNYHIKKCLAPCMGYISKEEYREQVNQIVSILEGKTDRLIKDLKIQMEEASKNLEFEKAADLRNKIQAIDRISERQKVSNISENDIDVIGIAKNETQVCIEIFFVRSSKMIGREHFFLKNVIDEKDKDILSNYLKQYYIGREILPNKIMIPEEIEEKEILQELLTTQANRKVEIKTPQKGEKLRLVEMAMKNAKITLENKEKEKYNVMAELKEVLKMDKLPRRIETFDISNISGEYVVAGMCVAQDGVIKKNLSRRFKIKTVLGQDDPKCTYEVVTRRLRHSVDILMDEKDKKNKPFGDLPDVIFADGGITQINAILQAIEDIKKETLDKAKELEIEEYDLSDLDIKVFGMVKNDKHQTRALMDTNRNELEISETIFNFITNFQDAVHDTAIEYHRKLRNESVTKSELDNVEGIGPKKKEELLRTFGSVAKIKKANDQEIAKIKGINIELARKIKAQLE